VGGERELQIPRLPPDFLSGLVVSVNLMRLSLKKAAYVVVLESSAVGNPEFARDDKGEGGAHLSRRTEGWTERPLVIRDSHHLWFFQPLADSSWKRHSTLCHPDPDFLYVAPSTIACAAFSKESRMRSANAVNVHRKSGGAKPRDLQFS